MKKKILLIEDDPFLIEIYTTKFKKEGFLIKSVKDGGFAVEEIKKFQPDVLLLDIVLPSVNGWEILRTIKNNKNLCKIKVVVLSNLGEIADVKKAVNLGAEKYLIKSHYPPTEVVREVISLFNSNKKTNK